MSSPERPFLAVSSNLTMLAKVFIRKANYRYNCDFLVRVSQPGPCDLLGEPLVMFEEATSRPLLALFSTFFFICKFMCFTGGARAWVVEYLRRHQPRKVEKHCTRSMSNPITIKNQLCKR